MSGRRTIHDVAERAGVSIATVSRALRGKRDMSAGMRDRVRTAAAELGCAETCALPATGAADGDRRGLRPHSGAGAHPPAA